MNIRQIVVVEGKYDRIAVKNACPDAVVIETRGFGLFRDRQLGDFIKKTAEERGIVILTDSDRAGLAIRRRIQSFVDKKYIRNAYIPMIPGKEKRKEKPSAEGTLGVEGMPKEVICDALRRCGVTETAPSAGTAITKTDLYADGLCSGINSSEKRRKLAAETGLPTNLSANRLLEALNLFLTYEEYQELVKGLDTGAAIARA